MTTITQQSEHFITDLEARRRNPIKPATLRAYRSYLRNWIVPQIGEMEVAAVDNGIMKKFVNLLVENGLSAGTISGITIILKMVISSETDGNGNRLHHRDWNTAYIDAPQIDLTSVKAPMVGVIGLNTAIRRATALYQTFYVIQAATGLRIGEMRALRAGPDTGVGSVLDLDRGVVYVRSQIWERAEQSPKSMAGLREVDLCPTIVTWLKNKLGDRTAGEYLFQSSVGTPMWLSTLQDHLQADGLPGTHCLRRFRCTHLENMSVPRVLVDYWIGHKGKSITDRYTKLDQCMDARKNWCSRAGLGFQLPGAPGEDVIIEHLYGREQLEEVL